jgi:hypothetical protein
MWWTEGQVIAQAISAYEISKEWLGAGGKPVPIEHAQARVNTCLACPLNDLSRWIWSATARKVISLQSQLREHMKIKLEGEDKLGTCSVCGCVLRLKVLVPIEHIAAHTLPEQLSKFPATNCWITDELKPKCP